MTAAGLPQLCKLGLLVILQVLLWSSILAPVNAWDNETQPVSIFRSRPDLQVPVLQPINGKHFPDRMAPGLYFISPYQTLQNGIYIYDNYANLVYSGFGSTGPGIIHSPQTCKYKGEIHLCFYQGEQMLGWGHGHGVIIDKHYRVVKSIEPSGTYQASSDMHEFKVIEDGKSALMTQYIRGAQDLCEYGANLCEGFGYIQQGVFHEIDIETGEPKFTWHSLEHVHPSESYVLPGTTEISGSGEFPDSPWDYFHINSIDKNADGDYLVSARHVSAIYKISGQDGHVIWRLNGAKSDYHLGNFSFSFQHDARFISDDAEQTTISLFNNGGNGFNQTQRLSNGLIVRLDHTTKNASVIKEITSPVNENGDGHMSRSQGSYQILPDGNQIMGWGSDAFWTEYDSSGDIVFDATIGTANVMNYRVHKFDDWVGIPLTKPALWTYSLLGHNNSVTGKVDESNKNSMFLYVSWNGHTQIASWRFFASPSSTPNPSSSSAKKPQEISTFTEIARVPKNGFETIHRLETTHRYIYAEAYDSSGAVLGSSVVVETWVPTERLRPFCDELACHFTPNEAERERLRLEAEEQQRLKEEAEREEARRKAEEEAARLEREKQRRRKIYIASFVVLGISLLGIMVFALRGYLSVSKGWRKTASLVERVRGMIGVGKGRRKGEGLLGRTVGLETTQYTEVPTRSADLDNGDNVDDWRRRDSQEHLYKIEDEDEDIDTR